mmetsp:Transcript_83792/g.151178  ORF Transcript_83792/g.151178 Transcript_83792/m.151178 type:complete len:214 (+) Transcript_83792:426-1067(+)
MLHQAGDDLPGRGVPNVHLEQEQGVSIRHAPDLQNSTDADVELGQGCLVAAFSSCVSRSRGCCLLRSSGSGGGSFPSSFSFRRLRGFFGFWRLGASRRRGRPSCRSRDGLLPRVVRVPWRARTADCTGDWLPEARETLLHAQSLLVHPGVGRVPRRDLVTHWSPESCEALWLLPMCYVAASNCTTTSIPCGAAARHRSHDSFAYHGARAEPVG